ncbi:MAG: VWA domain-containing protein [Verrucomicrobiota bacterium]|nr:VWA domain-containing protein [Verrucomicrobiota bacterium]
MEYRFAQPEWLWLLALIPLLFWLRGKTGAGGAVLFSSVDLVKALGTKARGRYGRLLPFFRAIGLVLIVCALARPQFGQGTQEKESSGVDIMLVLDLSGSMWAHDFDLNGNPVDRWTVVKKVVHDFIEKRPNDRIGMVVFATEPYLVSPPTLNHGWLLTNLDRLEIGSINSDRTGIGTALLAGVRRLQEQTAKSRIAILLTDGVNNTGNATPVAAAEAASAFHVKVYTIGVGKEGMVPMPVMDHDGQPARNRLGQLVFQRVQSSIDFETLKKISSITKAAAYRATETNELESIYGEIDRLEKTEYKLKLRINYNDMFKWPLLAGLFLLALEQLLSHTRYQRVP